MARIRTIKPEFFTSEDIVGLSPMARLLYIALWCEADREGRFTWKPKTFKMRYFPGDSANVDKLCGEVRDAALVLVYVVNDIEYAFIPTFHSHQHINPREAKSQLPEPPANVQTTREARVSDASARVSDAQVGKEGKGKEYIAPPDGVSASVWQDYQNHRKAKKATVSNTVIDGMRADAKSVGLTLEQAMQMQIKRGWTGFEPSWVTDKVQQVTTSGVLAGAI
jgi:hypothetical protein